MSETQSHKPHRGTLLTIALVLIILHGIFMFAVYWTTIGNIGSDAASWPIIVMALSALAGIIAGFGMWSWKKWGIYLYVIAVVASTIVSLIITGSLMMVFAGLLPMIIVGYILLPHMKHFD